MNDYTIILHSDAYSEPEYRFVCAPDPEVAVKIAINEYRTSNDLSKRADVWVDFIIKGHVEFLAY